MSNVEKKRIEELKLSIEKTQDVPVPAAALAVMWMIRELKELERGSTQC